MGVSVAYGCALAAGRFWLLGDEEAVTGLLFPGQALPAGAREGETSALRRGAGELEEYFTGRRRAFSVPVRVEGGTPFQRAVWAALREIPYGGRVSYGELAARLGRPGAARAVGGACGRNPLPILIPCHRVTAAGGGMGGYTPGRDWKTLLLALEQGTPG